MTTKGRTEGGFPESGYGPFSTGSEFCETPSPSVLDLPSPGCPPPLASPPVPVSPPWRLSTDLTYSPPAFLGPCVSLVCLQDSKSSIQLYFL